MVRNGGADVENFRALFQQSPLPMWVQEKDTQAFLAVNPAAERFYGYTEEEFRRMAASDLGPNGGDDELSLHRRKDGRTVEVSLLSTPVPFSGREAVLVIARDAAGKHRLEVQARQARTSEAVGRLAAGIAHDFNNMLTAIMGFSDLVIARLPASDPSRRPIEEIRKAGERATQLTRQLLAFSRRQVLAPELVHPANLLNAATANLRKLLDDAVALRVSASPDTGAAMVDPGQLEQILIQLAVNAREAMPDGGTLTIETRNVTVSGADTRERFPMVAGRYVLISVTDTGEGMDAEVKSHLFEPFFSTRGRGAGTGLGLATVYGIVKQSGGFIWVASEKGCGTTVEIYLPSVDEAAERAPVSAAVAEPGAQPSVLVVEDQQMVRTLVTTLLAEEGLSVSSAGNGEEALSVISDPSRPLDLLLTDVVMPGMNGTELVRRARELRPGLRVVFMTGYADTSLVRESIVDKGLSLLQKPFTRNDLVRKLHEALSRDRERPRAVVTP